jgi:uncharacterized protein YhaN
MKFRSITYRHFGPFNALTLDVSHGDHGLHIIHGGNEAGKTTALRGLGYFLFGFPKNKSDDFRYPATEQRIGATLADRHGHDLQAWRRRGNKNTLRGADDQTLLDEELLRRLVGSLAKDQFEMLFGLDHERLRKGGEAIVTGEGGLGKALFEAVAGLAGLPRIERLLHDQIHDLYLKQGQKPKINAGLNELKKLQEELQMNTLQIEAWMAQEQAQHAAQRKLKELEGQRDANRRDLELLQACHSALPVIDALGDFEERLDKLLAAPRLDREFAERHRRAVVELHGARVRVADTTADVERLTAELNDNPPHNAVLAEAETIERLSKGLGACLKAEEDRPGLHARMRELRGAARTILRECFKRDDLDNAESLRVSLAAQERINELGRQRLALLGEVEGDRARLADNALASTDCEQRLAALAQPPDLTALAALAREIEQQGPLEKTLTEMHGALNARQSKVAAVLQRLSVCWQGDLEDVAAAAVPAEAVVNQFVKRFADHEAEGLDLARRMTRCEQRLRECRLQIDGLLSAGPVPQEAELRQARDGRDAGVKLVGSSDTNETAAFIARHAPGKSLADALQASVAACDELADALRRDSQRVSELGLRERESRGADEERQALTQQTAQHAQRGKEIEEQWATLWQPGRVTPRSPQEMTGWLQQWLKLREEVAELAASREKLEQLARHGESNKAKLRETMQLGDGCQTASLAELLAMAWQRIKEAHDLQNKREKLEDRLRELRLLRQREETKKAQDLDKVERWQQEWGNAIAVIGLDASADPALATRYLGEHDRMFAELHKSGAFEMRLKGIDRDLNQFLLALTELHKRLDGVAATEPTQDNMAAVVDGLTSRLAAARAVAAERKLLEGKRATAASALQQARQRQAELEATLQSLRDQAGVAHDNEINEAIEKADARRDLEARIEAEREKLRRQARGKSLDQFRAEAVAAREGLEDRLAALRTGVEPLDRAIAEQGITAATARDKLDRWRQASSAAADCQQELASAVEKLRGQTLDYAALHLARQVLKRTIERFRQRHQGTLLKRAEHYFKLLTRGAYAGLQADENDRGEPVLFARRLGNPGQHEERVEPGGMSDGTRDQLFMALRLAGIEQHLEQREPMPLVVDDILVHFDQPRAQATLECLAELSRRTQVLLFTHHTYLVDLARALPAQDAVYCHDLK